MLLAAASSPSSVNFIFVVQIITDDKSDDATLITGHFMLCTNLNKSMIRFNFKQI